MRLYPRSKSQGSYDPSLDLTRDSRHSFAGGGGKFSSKLHCIDKLIGLIVNNHADVVVSQRNLWLQAGYLKERPLRCYLHVSANFGVQSA